MQQTLQSKFLDILLSLSLPRNILHYESLLTADSFALLSSDARHHSLFNALYLLRF
jgi:hypothetical protein